MCIRDRDYVVKNIPKYNLTKGINEKKYRSISEQVINQIPSITDWLDENFINKHNLLGWNLSINKLHKSKDGKNNLFFHLQLPIHLREIVFLDIPHDY